MHSNSDPRPPIAFSDGHESHGRHLYQSKRGVLTVLPVPVGPVIITCLLCNTSVSRRYVYRTESGVGMMSSAKDAPGSCS